MTVKTTTLLFALFILFLTGCPAQRVTDKIDAASEVDESSETKPTYLSPMPVEFVPEIFVPGNTYTSEIRHFMEPNEMCTFRLFVNNNTILYGFTTIGDLSFEYEFPDAQPFLDIIFYMAGHPGIFFDHSEFTGAPDGEFFWPEEYYESIYFGVWGSCGDYCDYCIGKASITGEPVLPELQYVFDQLKILRDELLLHPSTGEPLRLSD